MAAKLKSIIARIPWSLLLKAGAFGATWQYGPRWVALPIALISYLFPVFPLAGTVAPFVILLAFAASLPIHGVGSVVLSVGLFLILGNKELLFVGRNRVYETVILLFIFLGALEFFGGLFYQSSAFSFAELGVGATGLYILLRSLFGREALIRSAAVPIHPNFAAGLATFILTEFAGVVALIPMNLFYKTAFMLLAATVLIDLILHYIEDNRDPRNLFIPFALFFVFAVFMLISNTWTP